MKSKDQILLEEAYNEILIDEKINFKGALTAAALAASSLLGSNNAKAADVDKPVQGIEQSQKITVEDLIPRKEFDQVLDMMRQAVAKGDLKSAKQICEVVRTECQDAAMKVRGREQILKLADMEGEALNIFHNAYLGVVKTGMGAMANSARAAAE
jgi:hypothetical protein